MDALKIALSGRGAGESGMRNVNPRRTVPLASRPGYLEAIINSVELKTEYRNDNGVACALRCPMILAPRPVNGRLSAVGVVDAVCARVARTK